MMPATMPKPITPPATHTRQLQRANRRAADSRKPSRQVAHFDIPCASAAALQRRQLGCETACQTRSRPAVAQVATRPIVPTAAFTMKQDGRERRLKKEMLKAEMAATA